MRYSLLFAVLAAQIAFAQQPKSTEPYDGSKYDGYEAPFEDPEPNWSTAAYMCPLSIKTEKGEIKLSGYNMTWARQPIGFIRAEPIKYVSFKFQKKDEIDVICTYDGFSPSIILQIKGVIACGTSDKPSLRVACWTSDPYAGSQSGNRAKSPE